MFHTEDGYLVQISVNFNYKVKGSKEGIKCIFFGTVSKVYTVTGGIAGGNEGSISSCTVSGKKYDNRFTVYGAKIYSHYESSSGLVGRIDGDSISGCLVGGNTKIKTKQYVDGIIGMAVTPVNYVVSGCRIESTVTVWVDVNSNIFGF